jgi:hypothetical protein
MKRQTAVDWLVEQWPILESQIPERILEQAKEMEREQIIEAAQWMPKPFNNVEFIPELAEQYYTETFNP